MSSFPSVFFLLLSVDLSYIVYLTGSSRCCGEQRPSRRAFRSYRMFFRSTRNLYKRDSDYSNDRYNHRYNGGGAENIWDCNEGAEAGIDE